MEQHALKEVKNCLNTSIYSQLETSGGQISNPYLNVVTVPLKKVNLAQKLNYQNIFYCEPSDRRKTVL